MRLSIPTLLLLRRTAIGLLAAIDQALAELGWTPKRSSGGVASRDILDSG